ncbi:MAG TPA: galactokinase [Bacteroidia bacterium]|nr:galactokinase [Bacteroidia bacterium]
MVAGQMFREQFGGEEPSVIATAPGRINLIGEHIDYLDGWVMPVAIDRHLTVEAAPTEDGSFEIVPMRVGFGAPAKFGRDGLVRRESREESWLNYLIGVIAVYEAAGVVVPGFRAVVHSDLPTGAGLSSSAAFETATALVIESLAGAGREMRDRALLCQRAEHEYAGVPCGIMDQLAVGAGKAGRALLIDCRDLAMRPVPLPPGIDLLVTDTGVKHALADGEYRKRREQCEAALEALGCASFRGLSLADLESAADRLDGVLLRRARHAITEMERVHRFAGALERTDFAEMGRILKSGHESLRHDYEVSCDELDFLVDVAYSLGPGLGHVGSRMTGGGFGGSVVSLVSSGSTECFQTGLEDQFERRFGRRPRSFTTSAVDGACLIAVESSTAP